MASIFQEWTTVRPHVARAFGEKQMVRLLGRTALEATDVSVLPPYAAEYVRHPLYNEILRELREGPGASDLVALVERDLTAISHLKVPTNGLTDLSDAQWNNVWSAIGEFHALSTLLKLWGSRVAANRLATPAGGRPDFRVGDVAWGDIKTISNSPLHKRLAALEDRLWEIKSRGGGRVKVVMQRTHGTLRHAHFEGQTGRDLEAILDAVDKAIVEGAASGRWTWDPAPEASITIEVRRGTGMVWGGTGDIVKNPKQRLADLILSKPSQFHSTFPNIRVIVSRPIISSNIENELDDVLRGYVYLDPTHTEDVKVRGRAIKCATYVRVPGVFTAPTRFGGSALLLSGVLHVQLPLNGRAQEPVLVINRKARCELPPRLVREARRSAEVYYAQPRRFMGIR